MTADLHARLVAALDEEQARAEAATPGPWSASEEAVQDLPYSLRTCDAEHIAAQDPARTLARVAADRADLEFFAADRLHAFVGRLLWECSRCRLVLSMSARYGIGVEP